MAYHLFVHPSVYGLVPDGDASAAVSGRHILSSDCPSSTPIVPSQPLISSLALAGRPTAVSQTVCPAAIWSTLP